MDGGIRKSKGTNNPLKGLPVPTSPVENIANLKFFKTKRAGSYRILPFFNITLQCYKVDKNLVRFNTTSVVTTIRIENTT
jgi:hypothetical protein